MPRARALLLLAALAALAAAGSARAAAQATPVRPTGGISASATILFPPLTAVGVRPLQFGVVPAGATQVTVLPGTPQGGEWRLTGMRNRKSVVISFTLPASLAGPGGASLPVTFNGTYAGSCEIDGATNACDAPTYQTWNPVTTPAMTDFPERVKPGRPKFTENEYSVFIGGRLLPPPAPRAGTYSATITVNLTVN